MIGVRSSGEMFLEREYQNSVYYLEEADIQAQRQLFSIYKAEAKRLLDRKLPVPAYDQLLKLSASFNLLDARGSVSVTERADCFATMRSFARTIASAVLLSFARPTAGDHISCRHAAREVHYAHCS